MKSNQRRPSSRIERLEARIAPASLIVTDLNGDQVKFTSSSRSLSGSFSVTPTASGDGLHDLFTVDLSSTPLEGTGFTVTVTKGPFGDGVADIVINAGTNDLGVVNVAADLESITAGRGQNAVPAIKSLTVNSLGRFEGISGALETSNVNGSVGALVVKGDVDGTYFHVAGTLASVSIGGSLLGGTIGQTDDGYLRAVNIGKVSIKGDLRGGSGTNSGDVTADADLGSITIGGSIYGSSGNTSGTIEAFTLLTSVAVAGSIDGGSNLNSGSIYSFFDLGKVTVGGSVVGGDGQTSGSIGAANEVASIAIAGSVQGGQGNGSGTVFGGNSAGGGTIGKLTVGGSVIGGAGVVSGVLGSTYQQGGPVSLTTVVIGKSIVGGSGISSGGVLAYNGAIGSLTLKGSLVGGASTTGESGFIESDLHAGSYSIAGSLDGGSLGASAVLEFGAGIGTLKIGGSLHGAAGSSSAAVSCIGTIGVLNIHGDVIGGGGSNSGQVSAGAVTTETIGGLILPGFGANSGTVTP